MSDDVSSLICRAFVQELDFYNMQLDVALRKFQTYFRLPGEAQKIERLMEVSVTDRAPPPPPGDSRLSCAGGGRGKRGAGLASGPGGQSMPSPPRGESGQIAAGHDHDRVARVQRQP